MDDFAEAARRDPEAYERSYNPRVAAPDFQAHTDARAPLNERAWGTRRAADLAYGDHPRHRLDIYPGAGSGPRPVHLFLHGGYWRSGDKVNFGYLGAALAASGLTTVVANYQLCPDADLDAVVASARRAFGWVVRHAAAHGGDPGNVTISGHSAGAHLCAAILRGGEPLPSGAALRGATLISGIFDPTPTLYARVNAEIGLTPEVAARQRFEGRAPALPCPIALLVGGDEPEAWIALSRRYADGLARPGQRPEVQVLPGLHHFSILDEYRNPQSPVRRAIAAQSFTN